MPLTERPGPVQSAESVYRRVHVRYYDPNVEVAVSPQAFKPTSDDGTGISVVRTGFTTKPEDALCGVEAHKLNSFHIALVTVQEFCDLDLSVVEDAILDKPGFPDVPGHALVSNLNTDAYKTRKQDTIDKMLALAKIASRNIVYSPPSSSASAGSS